MKTDTMMKQLSNPIRFVIQHISSWSENQIEKPICGNLYQNYITWCESNGEGRISNNKFGGFLPPIGIEKKQVRVNGKRESIYIIDRSKIVAKLRESIGDIEEFLDTPEAETFTNTSTDIPVFDISEITPTEPEKKISESSTTDHIKKGKNVSPASPITNMTQDLFDSITNESPVASPSKSTDISLPPEIEHVESVDDRSEPASEIIKPANDEVEPSPIESVENELRASNEAPPQQISYTPGYQTREQREIRLRQKAVELGEDPDKFVTITEKDKLDSIAFRDRMQTDARMCGYAKEAEEDPSEYMDMTVRERLISEEIIRRGLEDKGITSSWLDTDEEWKKTINILQENGKILGKFNSLIQGKKLVVMNETGMASGEWHKFNEHLKALITEPKVSIERKGLEPIHLKDYSAFMVTSNQDAPLKIDARDARIVCFDVSARCRGNIPYFKRLAKILEHPDAPGVVMRYLLNRDLSNWDPQDIPSTKMKTDTMMKQLSNPIRFVIQHISSWSENQIEKPICGNLYQNYITWCESNGEGRISNNKFGGFLPPIGIEKKQVRVNGKRESIYIIDRSKIVAKLRESIGDIEEFLDTPEAETFTNTSTDIPVFDISEITPTEPEKKISESSTTDHIKKGKNVSPASPITNMTQDLFDSITNESPVASPSKSTDISLPPEIEHVESVDDRSEPASEIIKPANDEVEPSPIESVENELRASNEAPPQQISYTPGYQTREQREIRLRQKAVELGEDPDKFVTITEKDKLDSIAFRDRMQTDARMCGYAKEAEEDPSEYMDMTVRERLISEEIIRRGLEDKGITSSWLDTDEEWKKTINILQENGMLW
ncbi:926_t:CDS:2 [Entrophospora sp. SA101]|nr:926_t:CDS:2 [Entrophospora sp. SA101]